MECWELWNEILEGKPGMLSADELVVYRVNRLLCDLDMGGRCCGPARSRDTARGASIACHATRLAATTAALVEKARRVRMRSFYLTSSRVSA